MKKDDAFQSAITQNLQLANALFIPLKAIEETLKKHRSGINAGQTGNDPNGIAACYRD